jgi:hypothetical protein
MYLHHGDGQQISKAHQRPYPQPHRHLPRVPRVPMQQLATLDRGKPLTTIHQRVESARTI